MHKIVGVIKKIGNIVIFIKVRKKGRSEVDCEDGDNDIYISGTSFIVITK